MTTLVRRFLKTAIVFLVVGLTLGGWMIVRREFMGTFPSPYLASAHTHAILVGFVMMMILGVALWMFPRPAKGDTRYDPRWVEGAYWMITLGTGTRVAGEVAHVLTDGRALRLTVAVAGLLQILGLLVFFGTMWTRIRGTGSLAREGGGERF